MFRFVNFPKEKIIERLKDITKKEKFKIPSEKTEDFYNKLFFISGGDLRKAVNTLQMAVALDLIDNLEINEIMKISGFLEEKTLEELSISLKNKNVIRAGEIVDSIEILDSRNFIRQISETLPSLNLDPESIYKLRAFIGEIDYRISQGADEKIQISALLAMIIEKIQS